MTPPYTAPSGDIFSQSIPPQKNYFSHLAESSKQNNWSAAAMFFFLLINYNAASVKTLWLSQTVYFFFFISLFFFLRRVSLQKILIPVAAGVSVVLFGYGLLQKYLLFPIYLENINSGDTVYSQAIIARINSGRIFSLFRLPTLYAIICVILILFLLHASIQARGFRAKILWGLLAGLGAVNLIFTQSFGGLVCLAAGVLLYLLLAGILKFKYLAPALMIFVLIFSIFIGLRYSEAKKLEPVKLRLSNWAQAWRVLASAPITGAGLGNYEAEVSDKTRDDEAKSIYAHNFPLQFTAEAGWVFTLFLLLFGFIRWKKSRPSAPRNPDKTIHISIFATLALYNIIDIGFYFFAAALSGVVALSQAYRNPEVNTEVKTEIKTRRPLWLYAVLPLLLGAFLAWESLADHYRNSGDVNLSQKNIPEAETDYQTSAALNPLNFKALAGCAHIAFMKNQRAEAEKYLDRALLLYPEHAAGRYLKARIALAEGRPAHAFLHARRACRKAPLNASYYQFCLMLKNFLEKKSP